MPGGGACPESLPPAPGSVPGGARRRRFWRFAALVPRFHLDPCPGLGWPPPVMRVLGALGPLILVAFLYFATFPYHRGLNNPNEMTRVYLTVALVDDGSFSIDGPVRRFGNVEDKALREGRLYSSKAPLQSLVGVPFYAAARKLGFFENQDKRSITFFLRVVGSMLPAVLFLFVLLAFLKRRAERAGLPEGSATPYWVAAAVGSMLYPYGITYSGHLWTALSTGMVFLLYPSLADPGLRRARFRRRSLLLGFFAVAAPFAEYTAVLFVVPLLAALFLRTGGWSRKAELVLWAGLGGLLPAAAGLYAHHEMWGSAVKTGYSFLENKSFAEAHAVGFFGISLPRPTVFLRALFGAEAGLLFYSPHLVLGFFGLAAALRRRGPSVTSLPASLAVASSFALLFELYFISAHSNWRGGWTVGPRYIIPVVVPLVVYGLETLKTRGARVLFPALAGLSVLNTGFAAALYPHLSEVYLNPLVTFLWPSYRDGYASYGLAHRLGLEGGAANLVHVLPLLALMVYPLGARALRSRAALLVFLGAVPLAVLGMFQIPERDPLAALKENERLWGFWEPKPKAPGPSGRIFHGEREWRRIQVEAEAPDGRIEPCRRQSARGPGCFYGPEGWHRFGPEHLEVGGQWRSLLFLHPMRGQTVRARLAVPEAAARVRLSYGLTDAAVRSANPHPVHLRLLQGAAVLAEVDLAAMGLHQLEHTLSGTAALTLELTVADDGARVFGFDLEIFQAR